MKLIDLLKQKVEKQMAAYDEQLEAAQSKAKAKKAQAEADVAGADLEEQFLIQVNDIKDKMAEGRAYLKELTEAGEDKVEEVKAKFASFFERGRKFYHSRFSVPSGGVYGVGAVIFRKSPGIPDGVGVVTETERIPNGWGRIADRWQ